MGRDEFARLMEVNKKIKAETGEWLINPDTWDLSLRAAREAFLAQERARAGETVQVSSKVLNESISFIGPPPPSAAAAAAAIEGGPKE